MTLDIASARYVVDGPVHMFVVSARQPNTSVENRVAAAVSSVSSSLQVKVPFPPPESAVGPAFARTRTRGR